jgi:hypothetical protein
VKTLLACATALSMVAWASAARADSGSYTGNWKVELTHNVEVNTNGYHRKGPNTTHCMALTDNGTVGWPHSGDALLDSQYYGQFQVIGRNMLIFVEVIGSGEEVASWTFSSTATNGTIGKSGAFDYIQGGESYDSANAAFGTKGSC